MLHEKPLIAVVDDDLPFVGMLAEFLQEEGYPNISCLEGEQAYAIIKEKLPVLVILDNREQCVADCWWKST